MSTSRARQSLWVIKKSKLIPLNVVKMSRLIRPSYHGKNGRFLGDLFIALVWRPGYADLDAWSCCAELFAGAFNNGLHGRSRVQFVASR